MNETNKNMKIRANQLRIGDEFKKAENYLGTYTYKVKGNGYINSYGLLTFKCEILDCTDKSSDWIGRDYPVSFRRFCGAYKVITLLNK
jgi:hypothetical protein